MASPAFTNMVMQTYQYHCRKINKIQLKLSLRIVEFFLKKCLHRVLFEENCCQEARRKDGVGYWNKGCGGKEININRQKVKIKSNVCVSA